MYIRESIRLGLKELWCNKARSCLSVLGIIIGVVSLIVMMAMMDGMERFRGVYLEAIGGFENATISTRLPVIAGEAREDLVRPLTLEDAELIKGESRQIRYVSPEIQVLRSVTYQGKGQRFERVIGGNRDTLKIGNQRIQEGRPLSDEDIRRSRQVCVIGRGIRDKFFGPRVNPVGETLEISGIPFRVIGVLTHSQMNRRSKNILAFKNQIIYVPVTTLLRKSHDPLEIQNIKYRVHDKTQIEQAKRDVQLLIDKNHLMARDTEIKTQADRFRQTRKSLARIKLNFSILAGISLLVGGIGIMNIMLATVAQRVTEIGVRKAVGARFRDILLQFLMESVIISAAGGVIGVISSHVILALIERSFSGVLVSIGLPSVLLASAFSIVAGLCFGMIPAFKAARLAPGDALRHP